MPARRRHNFPKAIKRQALTRADGRCERINEAGERCHCRLQAGWYQFAHIIADGIGGPPTLANCGVWCTPCHRADFPRDMAVIARTKRVEARHVGVIGSRYRPMPGGVLDASYRSFDGFVRDRETGAVRSRPTSIDVWSL